MIKYRRFIEKGSVSRFHLFGLWLFSYFYFIAILWVWRANEGLEYLSFSSTMQKEVYLSDNYPFIVFHWALCIPHSLSQLHPLLLCLFISSPSLQCIKFPLLSRRDNSRAEGRTCLSRHFRRGARLDELHT